MLFGRLRKENEQQARRIHELEEILCPFNKHEWIRTGSHYDPGMGIGDGETIYHFTCERCKKQVQSSFLMALDI